MDGDLLAVDGRRHARHLLAQVGIVHHIDDLSLLLQLLEQRQRLRPQLLVLHAIADASLGVLAEPLCNVRFRQVLFAFEDHVLIGHLDHGRNLPFLQAERRPLNVLVTHVHADGGNQAMHAGTLVFRMLFGQASNSSGLATAAARTCSAR